MNSINRGQLFFGKEVVHLMFGVAGLACGGGLPAVGHAHVQAAFETDHAASETCLELLVEVLDRLAFEQDVQQALEVVDDGPGVSSKGDALFEPAGATPSTVSGPMR